MRRLALVVVVVCSLVSVLPARGAPQDPEPGTPEWTQRDVQNMIGATGRMQDEYANPAFGRAYWTEALPEYLASFADQLQHPNRPVVTASRVLPGEAADPYRRHWDGARGVMSPIEYTNRYGARITGHVWGPIVGAPDPVTGAAMQPPFPGIVITTGSIQGYEQLYWWAAQGLAEAGYVVMTYDVQGQGESEVFGHNADGSINCAPSACPGVPFQQADNFFSGTIDALKVFLSDRNPLRGQLDPSRIGLAGHSLGATAVTQIGNRPSIEGVAGPNPVDVVVAWDSASLAQGQAPRVPTMSQNAEYFFNPTPTPAMPSEGKRAWYTSFVAGGAPAFQLSLRSSTHLEWTFVPYILPASRTGERVAMYYTLAWFDRWLKGDDGAQRADAERRLVATVFDASADRSAIGAGSYDPVADTNLPYLLEGDSVAEHLSFYYRSSYSFGGVVCEAMRTGC